MTPRPGPRALRAPPAAIAGAVAGAGAGGSALVLAGAGRWAVAVVAISVLGCLLAALARLRVSLVKESKTTPSGHIASTTVTFARAPRSRGRPRDRPPPPPAAQKDPLTGK